MLPKLLMLSKVFISKSRSQVRFLCEPAMSLSKKQKLWIGQGKGFIFTIWETNSCCVFSFLGRGVTIFYQTQIFEILTFLKFTLEYVILQNYRHNLSHTFAFIHSKGRHCFLRQNTAFMGKMPILPRPSFFNHVFSPKELVNKIMIIKAQLIWSSELQIHRRPTGSPSMT